MIPRRQIRQALFVLLCVTAAAALVSVCVMKPVEKISYIDAYQFVKSWNTLADEGDNLTRGVKISSAVGRHTFRLGKDIFVHYRVEKVGILHRKISFILYENPHLSGFGIKAGKRQKIQGLFFTYDIEKKKVQVTPFYTKFPFSKPA